MHFKAGNSSQIDFFFFFHPTKSAYSDSKTFFRFWKNPKKIQKRPFLQKKWKNPKNIFKKPERAVKLIFFLSPLQKCLFWFQNSSDFGKLKKNPKKTILQKKCKKTTLIPKIGEKKIKSEIMGKLFFPFLTSINVPTLILKSFNIWK